MSAASYFQLARAFVVLLMLAVVIAAILPRNVGDPLLPSWLWALVGISFWGSFFSVLGYYNAGGRLALWQLFFAMASRIRQ